METLKIERHGDGVVRVEMARPAVFNAFNEQMIQELDMSFRTLGQDDRVRAIVLAGQGRAFSAGADLEWMQRASQAALDWNVADARRFAAMLQSIATCSKPTIAEIHGLALGGGVGLACACDLAVASPEAKFAVSETKFGILPSVIGPYLTNAVGKRQALRLALTARRIGAEEAQRIGLVQEIAPPGKLNEVVSALIGDISANGPRALSETKNLFAQFAVGPIATEVQELTAQTIARVRGTEEAREGFAAFLGKRPPAWSST